MSLFLPAPDIRGAVLDLPRTLRGRDPIAERDLRPIAAVSEWSKQRALGRAHVEAVPEGVVLDVSGGPRPHVSGGVAMGAAPGGRSR